MIELTETQKTGLLYGLLLYLVKNLISALQ